MIKDDKHNINNLSNIRKGYFLNVQRDCDFLLKNGTKIQMHDFIFPVIHHS